MFSFFAVARKEDTFFALLMQPQSLLGFIVVSRFYSD